MRRYADDLLPEEKDILHRLTDYPLDFEAMNVVTNIHRAAQMMRQQMEREVLSTYNLSWTAFAFLYNLWIWGQMETRQLARSMAVTVATVSSITNTLERKELCQRKVNPDDRRLVLLTLTDKGRQVMEELYPLFNQGERKLVHNFSEEEKRELTLLLRKVNHNLKR